MKWTKFPSNLNIFWTWTGFWGLYNSRVSWPPLYVPKDCSDQSLRFKNVYDLWQITKITWVFSLWSFLTWHFTWLAASFVFPKRLRHDMTTRQGQRSPQVALHPSVSITVGVWKFHKTCWQLNGETKCSILLACVTNGGILLNVSWNGPKHASKENKASVLCEYSGTLVLMSAASTWGFGVVFAGALWPVDVREGANKRPCCRLRPVG